VESAQPEAATVATMAAITHGPSRVLRLRTTRGNLPAPVVGGMGVDSTPPMWPPGTAR